ncbi:MAG: zinc dependent phospholipase C family protein [Sporomusaceae bacterium]|nr:zinc dependent phospholipase C family protein [Sporomusaceae bacterium]
MTHYLVCKDAIKRLDPIFWREYSNFVGFGSFGPDLFYVKDVFISKAIKSFSYKKVSDEMHWDGTLDCFCAMLDYIKASAAPADVIGKMKAFAYGFYGHVVTDCVFHPFVYRSTCDHWRNHPEDEYKDHKNFEGMVDSYIFATKKNADPDFALDVAVGCGAGNNHDMLDPDIADLYMAGIRAAYSGKLDFEALFMKREFSDEKHPIHKAYEDFAKLIGGDFYAVGKIHYNFMALEPVKPYEEWEAAHIARMNEAQKPWFPAPGNDRLFYSALGLYNYTVKAVETVFSAGEAYFGQNEASAKEFLCQQAFPYFTENYNLDTGLPASLNGDETNASADNATRFGFGAEILDSYYRGLATTLAAAGK